jgi:hypothetical protein
MGCKYIRGQSTSFIGSLILARRIYKGAIPLKFSLLSPSVFSVSSSSNYLSKPSYPVYILSVMYIKRSIFCLKTSYRYLIETDNSRIYWECFSTNSTILGYLSLDPGLLVSRLRPYIYCCLMVSQDRLESLYSSTLLLWVICIHLQTYLYILIGTTRDLLQ